MPKVSVIVPNYNHARFLERRVGSVLDQTYRDFELIYLDDASTDESNQVFSRFDDERIRTCFNARNSGSTFKQWNKGAQLARGEYLWFAESDDYADVHFLERLVPALEEHPGVGIAYCQSWQIDEHSRILGSMSWWTESLEATRWKADYHNDGNSECIDYLLFKPVIPNASAALLRKSSFQKAGGADETMRIAGDWLLYASILLDSDIYYRHEHLNYFRCHTNNVRSRNKKGGLNVEEVCRVVTFLLRELDVPQERAALACDKLLGLALSTMVQDSIPWPRIRRIHTMLRQIDPRVELRILSKLFRYGMKTLSPS